MTMNRWRQQFCEVNSKVNKIIRNNEIGSVTVIYGAHGYGGVPLAS